MTKETEEQAHPFRDAAVKTTAYDAALASWSFPRFAKDFPRNDGLDELVVAFAKGDYGLVRERAPALVTGTEDEAVKRAVERLLAALEPDKGARVLFGLTAALLVVLTAWWLTHDHPSTTSSAPTPPPSVEIPR